ncbi:MAG: hypothetical protein SF187_08785 [Deltaproteobacteria bacterium]|nr:hypothetical protein [Deltaproteobacteria bacterium]
MNQNDSLAEDLKRVRKGRGRKIAYLLLALAALGILLGVFVSQMRGTDVEQSSAAMVEVVPRGNTPPTIPDAAPQPSL